MRFDQQIFLEIPGYLIVDLSDSSEEWGVIHEGKLIQRSLATEEEAKQRAGSSYIRLMAEATVEQYLRRTASDVVREYVDHPHLPELTPDALISDLQGAIMHFARTDLGTFVLQIVESAIKTREERKKQQAEKAKTCTDGP